MGSWTPRRSAAGGMRGNEVQRWHVVECQCWHCGHRREIPHAWLKAKDRAERRLAELSFRCAQCGATSPHWLTVYWRPR